MQGGAAGGRAAASRANRAHVVAIELRDVDADRRGLDLRQLASLDEDGECQLRLLIWREENEPRVRRQVQATAAPLGGAGLATAIGRHTRRAKPVVYVVGTVDLLAHAFTDRLEVLRGCGHSAAHVGLLRADDMPEWIADQVHER